VLSTWGEGALGHSGASNLGPINLVECLEKPFRPGLFMDLPAVQPTIRGSLYFLDNFFEQALCATAPA
jgi:hypothetical protein